MHRILALLFLATFVQCQGLSPTPYIINGTTAEEGQFPYMAGIRFNGESYDYGFVCGGSILSPSWVLTAASCCTQFHSEGYPKSVYTGSIHLTKGGQTTNISYVVMHPDYNGLEHDQINLCMVKLEEPLELGGNVEQVTLPPSGDPINTDDRILISGWGETDPHRSPADKSEVLQYGNYNVASEEDCRIEADLIGVKWVDSYFCSISGPERQGMCAYDRGGPVIRDGVQIGVASFTFIFCASVGGNSYHTKLSLYIDWLKDVAGDEAQLFKFAK